MSRPERDICRRFSTLSKDVEAVVPAMAAALGAEGGLTLVFVSPSYDLDVLGPALHATFPGPLIGCTSAGEIGASGFQRGGLVAMSLDHVRAETWSFDVTSLEEIGEISLAVDARLGELAPDEHAVALLLVDGLSGREEHIAATLYHGLGDLPILGGSAGDDLAFQRTAVLDGGRFVSGRATLTLLRTTLPLTALKHQHHAPTDARLVVTAADPERRIIKEIDGLPAVEGYAAKLGVSAEDVRLRPELTRAHPLMLRVGTEHFVRSVRAADENGWLHLYCAVDRGALLTVGETRGVVPGLRDRLDAIYRDGPIGALLVFDCVLRRLELEERGADGPIGGLLSASGAIGLCTYGEQFGPLHINQTLVGLALGVPRQ